MIYEKHQEIKPPITKCRIWANHFSSCCSLLLCLEKKTNMMALGLILATAPSEVGGLHSPWRRQCNKRYSDLLVWLTSSPVWSVDFGHDLADLGLSQPSLLVEMIDDDIRVVSHHGFKSAFQSARYGLWITIAYYLKSIAWRKKARKQHDLAQLPMATRKPNMGVRCGRESARFI